MLQNHPTKLGFSRQSLITSERFTSEDALKDIVLQYKLMP